MKYGATLSDLAVPFPDKLISRVDAGGGRQADYVAVDQVIQRLLAQHGPFDWIVDRIEVIGIGPDTIIAVVGTLTLEVDGRRSSIGATGSERLYLQKRDGDLMLKENAVETAEASALKRAASKIGVGLHLWAQDGYWLDTSLSAHEDTSAE